MHGRLPDAVLNNKKRGAQAADWYLRLTRERIHIAEEVKRLAANVDVATIVDLQRMNAILDNWPDRQPPEWSEEHQRLTSIPEALGAAYFIESLTGGQFRTISQGGAPDDVSDVSGQAAANANRGTFSNTGAELVGPQR